MLLTVVDEVGVNGSLITIVSLGLLASEFSLGLFASDFTPEYKLSNENGDLEDPGLSFKIYFHFLF